MINIPNTFFIVNSNNFGCNSLIKIIVFYLLLAKYSNY